MVLVRPVLVVLALSFAAGCGGSGGGPTGPTGPIAGSWSDGAAFRATSVRAVLSQDASCTHFGVTGPVTLLEILVDGGLAETYQGSFVCDYRQNSRGVGVRVWSYGAGSFGPGTYAIHDDATGGTSGFAWEVDALCDITSSLTAVAATVTIEQSDATHVAGRLELSLPGGGHVQGRFDAPAVAPVFNPCETLGYIGGTSGPGCVDSACIP